MRFLILSNEKPHNFWFLNTIYKIDEKEHIRHNSFRTFFMKNTANNYLFDIDNSFSKVLPIERLNHDKAVLTHYLHNMHNGVTSIFEKDALNFIKLYVKHQDASTNTKRNSDEALQSLLFSINAIPFPPPKDYKFTFIDLFAGIGGFKLAMQNLGGKCVFASEWDKEAQKTYQANFGDVPFGDITKSEVKKYIPNQFDILCAGFPCQAFSIAGRRGGFEDTRGTLFFEVAEILKKAKPKAFFLENVKGLVSHERGATLETILNVLRNDLNYYVPDPKVLNAKDYGVPQNRERIFIVGFRKDLRIDNFQYPYLQPVNNYFSSSVLTKLLRVA